MMIIDHIIKSITLELLLDIDLKTPLLFVNAAAEVWVPCLKMACP